MKKGTLIIKGLLGNQAFKEPKNMNPKETLQREPLEEVVPKSPLNPKPLNP